RRARVREGEGERAEPRTDLDHVVARADPGGRRDALDRRRVDDEVLPERAPRVQPVAAQHRPHLRLAQHPQPPVVAEPPVSSSASGAVVGGSVVIVTAGVRSEYRLVPFGYHSGDTTTDVPGTSALVDTGAIVVLLPVGCVLVGDAPSPSPPPVSAATARTPSATTVTASATRIRGGRALTTRAAPRSGR